MEPGSTTLPFVSVEDIETASHFIAQLVQRGIVFTSRVRDGEMVISYTGGF